MIASMDRSDTVRSRRLALLGGQDSGYTLTEVILAIAIVGMAILIVLAAVSGNLSGIQVLKSLDERVALAQQVMEEIESGIASEGRIPDQFSSMVAPVEFPNSTGYSYRVVVSDVLGDAGSIPDLRRVEVYVSRTLDGQSSSLKLCTIVRVYVT